MNLINKTEKFVGKVPSISHKWIFGTLVFGFICKAIGAAWDVSYHFKHFREFLQLPHLLNAFGDAVIVILLGYLWFREPKQDRKQLRIIIYGIAIFVIGIGVDQWSHETFGIDLTTWSPSHFILYVGTFFCMFGAFLYVLRDFHHSRIAIGMRRWLGLIFSYFILENLWFPLLQQEQGVIMAYYLKKGVQLADSDLLDLFFSTNHDVYSGLPAWLYGTWIVMITVFVFQLAKRLDFHKYSATIIAILYVIQRVVMNGVFSSVNYPLSTMPYFLIPLALIFDVVFNNIKNRAQRDFLASLVPIGVIVILGLINLEFPIHPPIDILYTIIFSIPAAFIGYFCARLVFSFLFQKFVKGNGQL